MLEACVSVTIFKNASLLACSLKDVLVGVAAESERAQTIAASTQSKNRSKALVL